VAQPVSATPTARRLRTQAANPGAATAVTAVTAFIGRALRGPVNQPLAIASFSDYQRLFGGLWQLSMLSYALEQYFQNGGREAIVVRVCNGGRPPSLTLPAGRSALTLIGLWPGTRDFLRASVDYDGTGAAESDRFNLIVQRVRAPGSEHIEDQEIFRRVSIQAGAERSVAGALTGSRLVRARGPLPRQRPDVTRGSAPASVGYVHSNSDGDDGDVLTGYDIIGDARRGSGLFALDGAEPFSFLCVPPLARELDVGLPALLVALRICRQRQAMLLVDPPLAWAEAPTAIEALRNWPLYSDSALMFFPRVLAFDRLRGRHEVFGSAAAGAGLLARLDCDGPVWRQDLSHEEPLRPLLRPATIVTDLDQARLLHLGVNPLPPPPVAGGPTPSLAPRRLRTLLPEEAARGDSRDLALRRRALHIMNSVERGTRWAIYEKPGPGLWSRVRSQVMTLFQQLDLEGAFAAGTPQEQYFVICDQRLNDPAHVSAGRFQLLFGFALSQPADFHTCLVTHEPSGSSVRPVSVNRYALPPRS